MKASHRAVITVGVKVSAPVTETWELFTDPWHIIHWYQASDDWHTPRAENDARPGGRFVFRMESRDGREGFDFSGEYTAVQPQRLLEFRIDDGRRVKVTFSETGSETTVTESFEAEETHTPEMQQAGWQSILGSFKKYAESRSSFRSLSFSIDINTSPEQVYNTMLSDEGFQEWTSVFNPHSHFEGTWAKGSRMLFLGAEKDGTTGGMFCRIKENIPNRYVSIEYAGVIRDGRISMSGPDVEGWAGGLENYTIRESGGGTELLVQVDTHPELESYFRETYPRALKKLKKICEKG